MGEQTTKSAKEERDEHPTFKPSFDEQKDIDRVAKDYITCRNVMQKSYNQFNGRTLTDCIDDWEKRWNGWLPMAPFLNQDRSNMFLNITRNIVVGFVSKVGLKMPEPKILAVNKQSGLESSQMAKALEDLNDYSNNEENASAKFTESVLEAAIKGTVIKYEGYLKYEQETELPVEFDAETGKVKTEKEIRTLFDNCYQENVYLQDFCISNPYQPEIQKQPFLIWKKIQMYDEVERELGHYPNWKYIVRGNYSINSEIQTFYSNQEVTELAANQVEVLRYYNKRKNKHIILVNGIPLYRGVIPFKDGDYPFAKGWHEPFNVNFFWGSSLVQKVMGDQDLINTLWNMMVDKTYGSLQPFGLSSDLDDLVEDTVLEPNKIRKVGDINNWKFETLPGINSGEESMLQSALNFIKENSGAEGGMGASSPRGGKVTMRQAMLKQQDAETKLGFTSNYLEDFERDRTLLRLHHILQFYSIPKVETITDKKGKDIEKFFYRDVVLPKTKLVDGKIGTRILKLTDNDTLGDTNKKKKMADNLSTIEAQGEIKGTQIEALALNVDTFFDFNYKIQVVKRSSFENNQLLDRAELMEFANWRIGLAQLAPFNISALIKKVEETYDIDSEEFEQTQQNDKGGIDPRMMAMAQMQKGGGGMPQPAQAMAPGNQLDLGAMMGQ